MKTLYSKTSVKLALSKRPKIGFQYQLLLNAGQKYCRMLQGEHSAMLWTFSKLPFVIKILVLSIFEWQFYTCFIVDPDQLASNGLEAIYIEIHSFSLIENTCLKLECCRLTG